MLLASLVFAVAAARVGRARRARAAPARRRGARRPRRRLPRQDRDAHRRHARRGGDPAARRRRTSRRATRCWARSRPACGARNPTADALHAHLAGAARDRPLEVPFSSRWKWSGIAFDDGTELVLGAPEVLVRAGADPALAHEVGSRQEQRLRVLLFARTRGLAEPEGDGEPRLPDVVPLALRRAQRAHAPRRRDDHRLPAPRGRRGQDHLRRRPGDGRGRRARGRASRRTGRVTTGAELPAGGRRRCARARSHNTVFARVQPEHKRQLVAALRRGGRRVGHGRRRRQRRARAQGVRRRRGARLGQPAREGRGRRRARERELRGDPVRDRGGPQDPAQRAARGQAVRRPSRSSPPC